MVGLRTHDSDYGARRKNLNRHRRRKNTKKKEENFSRSFRRKITPKKLDFQTAINAPLSLRRSQLAAHPPPDPCQRAKPHAILGSLHVKSVTWHVTKPGAAV